MTLTKQTKSRSLLHKSNIKFQNMKEIQPNPNFLSL